MIRSYGKWGSYTIPIDTSKIIISVHVPRCAGTTLYNFLNSIFKMKVSNFCKLNFNEIKDEKIELIHGHFPSNLYDDHLEEIEKITWIRDPLTRLISNYFLDMSGTWTINNDNNWLFFSRLRFGRINFVEYAELMRNGISNYIVNDPNDFLFIGRQEEFSLDIRRFLSKIGKEEMADNVVDYNVQGEIKINSILNSLTDNDIKYIEYLNREDYTLYKAMLEVIKERTSMGDITTA